MNIVYLVRSSNEGPGPVLIGTTTARSLKRHIASLQRGNPEPLTITHTFDGDERLERALHVRFAEHRIRGDWYAHEILDDLPDGLIAVARDPSDERRRLAAIKLRDLTTKR